ncbi:ribulose-5-phosphate 3-epimerase [Georgenia satyanarayanai]|uniref:Ribulose-phosphate 3-epimerase n=1 Tax=Georgenia satyanarayanai TaxID=860221 RepID=A0A2Y8ZYH9_9MICO|nr:ribulose-phosphate 3-epimerase [Georgenia satyanarayanai]PYG02304.1 ribulose-5-phosphate 3-epimerase [Georgenia satyanarayanai]SSA37164.1 ribulose-5-phosphate 3-epimerase [Georgenia satyanarayanai]
MAVRITPSILNADFADLTGELGRISGADLVHVDVMDNHFVPNLTVGLPVVERIVAASPVPVDAHLMIEDPDRWARGYAEAGCASVTFHAEASVAPIRLAREIRDAGARAAVAVRPTTDITPYLDYLEELDMLLVMTVEPGFGGQRFLESTVTKIAAAREAIDASGRDIWLQVDGGISRDTIAIAARAGADTFVAGSAVYGAEDPNAEVSALRELAAAAR